MQTSISYDLVLLHKLLQVAFARNHDGSLKHLECASNVRIDVRDDTGSTALINAALGGTCRPVPRMLQSHLIVTSSCICLRHQATWKR